MEQSAETVKKEEDNNSPNKKGMKNRTTTPSFSSMGQPPNMQKAYGGRATSRLYHKLKATMTTERTHKKGSEIGFIVAFVLHVIVATKAAGIAATIVPMRSAFNR